MAGNELVFLDCGVLVNLLSSGFAFDIMNESGYAYATAAGVEAEQFFLWPDEHEPNGQEPAREIVTATALVQAAVLQAYTLDEHLEEFVALAMHLSDRQAKVAVLAAVNGATLLTDDRRTRLVLRQLGLKFPTSGTTSILQRWQSQARVSDATVTLAARRIAQRAQFYPPEDDQYHSWWLKLLRV